MRSVRSPVHPAIKLVVLVTVVLVGASSQAVVAATAHPSHGTPVFRPAPAAAPPATRRDGTCQVRGSDPFSSVSKNHGLVWVRHHPTSVVSVWIPGLNTKRAHCQAVRRVSGSKVADRLAAAIERARRLPRGLFCPLDDGTSVVLYFTFADGRDEYVDVSFTGCHSVGAPGRAARETTSPIDHELKQVAPHRWAHYV